MAFTQTPVHFKTTALYTGGTWSVYMRGVCVSQFINALAQALHIYNVLGKLAWPA